MPDPMPLSTPTYARLREKFRGEILGGHWPPGTHRTLAELAASNGVSLSPVREALLTLSGEGLVELREHKGALVPLLDATLLANLYDLRATLQALLARRAAERATAAQIAAMAHQQQAHAKAAARHDAKTLLAANEAFHAAIDEAADNPQVATLFRARSGFVHAVRLRLGFGPGRPRAAASQHRVIIEAIAARNAQGASDAAFAHAMDAKADLLARFAAAPTAPVQSPRSRA